MGLADGAVGWSEWLANVRRSARLCYLTVDPTGVCDLTCPGMCYYHPGIDVRREFVPVAALCDSVACAHHELGLQNLVFAGKEPLQQMGRLEELARFAAALPNRKFGIGIVSNGRAIESRWKALDGLAHDGVLSFLDISIDSGLPQQHDAIRGVPGTFDRAFAALARTARAWPNVRVSAASVLRPDNADGLLALLIAAAPFNRNFFITPIQPPPFTATPPLRWAQIRDFLHRLKGVLQGELRGAGVEVMVSLLGLYVHDAASDGLIDLETLREDEQGQLYVQETLGENLLQTHLQVFPETASRIGRILYTGAYLPNTHFLQDPNPERFAVGYVQRESLAVLFRRTLEDGGILAQMTQSRSGHACRDRACWKFCFGGLAAAEHSFVGGAPIQQPPILCPKLSPPNSSVPP